MKRLIVALFVATALPPAAFAQVGTVAGTVVNADNRRPIEGAIVRVTGTPYAAFTRADGTFTLLNVPPGTYEVTARRFGFATQAMTGVELQIGRKRRMTFALHASHSDAIERAEYVPLFVDPIVTGTTVAMNREQILSIPSLGLSGGLSANGGYTELPSSLATLSLADLHRGIINLPSVRGARPEATQYLLDGIAVTNPVYGSPPLMLEPLATGSVAFSPAHVDAQHGGALSGLVEESIRSAGPALSGAAEFESATIGNALGASTSGSGTYRAHGFLAGPLPFADSTIGFSVAGHLLGDRITAQRDANGEWHSSGVNTNGQLVAKLTFAPRPSVRLSIAGIGQRRSVLDADPDFAHGDSVAPPSVRDDGRFLIVRAEKRFERTNIALSIASNHGSRLTCSTWQGVCVTDRLARVPLGTEIPIPPLGGETPLPPPPKVMPYALSGQFFGGEDYTTHVLRLDVTTAPTDHHTIAAGVYASQHDISYRDAFAYGWYQGTVLQATDVYRARPREFASYVQDAIEYDLVTIHIGVRFDYENVGGTAFVNPQDPTNGTTAREVCNGTAPGINTVPFTYGGFTGEQACFHSPAEVGHVAVLLDSAARLSQRDDFHAVKPKQAFSPRFGLSFPLTETSGIYFNIGRYARQPVYHDAYRNTGLGTRAGPGPDGDGFCPVERTRPGTSECAPNLLLDPRLPEFVGNPDLSFEVANAWEAGFASTAGPHHSLDVSFFRNTQGFLPSAYFQELTPDIGLLYGVVSKGTQRTARSRGWIQSFGASMTIRRRLEGAMSYVVNYKWQRSSESGASPDLAAEVLAANELFVNDAERLTARNRTHTFNAQMTWQWRLNVPARSGKVGSLLLRNSRTDITASAASASQPRTLGQVSCPGGTGCSQLADGIPGTGWLVNVLYVRTIPVQPAQWAFVVRALNVFDADDGSLSLISIDRRRLQGAGYHGGRGIRPAWSLRRVLTGVSLKF